MFPTVCFDVTDYEIIKMDLKSLIIKNFKIFSKVQFSEFLNFIILL